MSTVAAWWKKMQDDMLSKAQNTIVFINQTIMNETERIKKRHQIDNDIPLTHQKVSPDSCPSIDIPLFFSDVLLISIQSISE